jgi:hypothetical protein
MLENPQEALKRHLDEIAKRLKARCYIAGDHSKVWHIARVCWFKTREPDWRLLVTRTGDLEEYSTLEGAQRCCDELSAKETDSRYSYVPFSQSKLDATLRTCGVAPWTTREEDLNLDRVRQGACMIGNWSRQVRVATLSYTLAELSGCWLFVFRGSLTSAPFLWHDDPA